MEEGMSARTVAVTVIGNDRPGIAAGVTRVLYEAGCNLEDVTSTILRGHFAMMLVVSAPEGLEAPALERALAPVATDLGLVVTARPVDDLHVEVAAPTHMVSVYGSDRPGIVYRVVQALTDAGANITDLTSRVIGEEGSPVYALMLEVSAASAQEIEERLGALRSELKVDITVRAIEPDVL
jgi:glycine cleavage system transcriptional repressor